MNLKQSSTAVHALGDASTALLMAAADLALADKWDEARAANSAAREANEVCRELCEGILSRWWVKLIMRAGDWVKSKTQ
jgi:hypothetical protein